MAGHGLIPMVWLLIDPQGKTHQVYDLASWARENAALFFPVNPPENAAQRIVFGFQAVAATMRGTRKHPSSNYKGWTLGEVPRKRQKDEHYQNENESKYDLVGKSFGVLKVLEETNPKIDAAGRKKRMFLVHCNLCGKDKIMSYPDVLYSKSCGCRKHIVQKVCVFCGRNFLGHPRAKYCPKCAEKNCKNGQMQKTKSGGKIKMQRVIDGKRYNTDTAKRLGSWESDQDYQGLHHEEETLYLTKTGNYFLHGCGGAASRYNKKTSTNSWIGGEQIVPISEEYARKWAADHLTENEYDMIFGDVENTGGVRVSVQIPAEIMAKMNDRMNADDCTRNSLILAALRKYLK